MDKYNVKIMPKAARDIDEIYKYLANFVALLSHLIKQQTIPIISK